MQRVPQKIIVMSCSYVCKYVISGVYIHTGSYPQYRDCNFLDNFSWSMYYTSVGAEDYRSGADVHRNS